MKTKFNPILLLVLLITIVISCNNPEASQKNIDSTDHSSQIEKEKDCDHVHWSHHEGEEGPQNWANLCDGYSACGGISQSPINIISEETYSDSIFSPLVLNYSTSGVDIINNGHTVQFNINGDNNLLIGDKEYKLLQFHYHAKSEHLINGEHYPLEVHFVHQHADNDFAVLGIMIEEGEENNLFTDYLNNFPSSKGEYNSANILDMRNLFPSDLSFYHYQGSLTTPPCSEVVSWYVLKTPLTASVEQIEKFSQILHDNYRPVMPVNDRVVYSAE